MSDQIFEVFLSQEQSKCINQRMPRGYSLQFSSSHTRRVQMPPNPVKPNKGKTTRSKMNQAANNSQNGPIAQPPALKNEKEKKVPAKKENFSENDLVVDAPESGNTKKKKQQEKIKEKEISKNEKQQNQILQQMMNTENQIKGAIPVSEDMKVCFQILQQLKKNESASPFLQKVDAQAQQCLDYYKVIKDPMDLSKVESNLKQGIYQTRQQFADDIKKIWANSFLYNKQGSQIYKMTEDMCRVFEKLYSQVKNQSLTNQPFEYLETLDTPSTTTTTTTNKKASQNTKAQPAVATSNVSTAPTTSTTTTTTTQAVAATATAMVPTPAAAATSTTAATTTTGKPEKKKKGKNQAATTTSQPVIEKVEVRLTQEEINQIYQNVQSMSEGDTKILCDMIKDYCAVNNESIELNIENLPVQKAREVYEFVVSKVRQPSPQVQQKEEAQDTKKKKKVGKLEKKDIPLTISEKKQLGINIRRLAPEDLNGIWSIVQDSQHNSEVIEFDIDTLPVRKARELEAYVKERAAQQTKKQRVNKMNPQSNPSQTSSLTQEQAISQTSPPPQAVQQSSVLPQSSSSTTTTYPQQALYTQGQGQQYQQAEQHQSLYNQASNYTQQHQLVSQNSSSAQSLPAKVNSNQVIPQANSYLQGNSMAQVGQLPTVNAITPTTAATAIPQMQGYNHSMGGGVAAQGYPQQTPYPNQMIMGQQYTSAFPIQSPIQNTIMTGYQNRAAYTPDASQQAKPIQGMMSTTQQPYPAQTYNQQAQPQYPAYANNVQGMYMNQPIAAGTTNGTHSRNMVPTTQMQYPNSAVQNGMGQYPATQQGYYNAQQYPVNPSQYQQQMNMPQYANNTTAQIHGNAYNTGHNAQQNQHNSEQSSDGILSESEEE